LSGLIREAELGHDGLSSNHPYVAILMLRLADALLQAGDNARAQATASAAQRILEDAGLGASRSAADALRISGLALLRQGNRENAERQFDRAMKLLRPLKENPSSESSVALPATPEFAALLAAEGELAGELQNYTAATDDYRQALDELDKLFESQAANHPLRADYLHALAMLLVREKKPAEAKPLLEESLAIDRRVLAPGHPATVMVMEDLASLLEKIGSTEQAAKLRNEAKQLHRKPAETH
jgi:tetratricopeptide (TPR) repeat protein